MRHLSILFAAFAAMAALSCTQEQVSVIPQPQELVAGRGSVRTDFTDSSLAAVARLPFGEMVQALGEAGVEVRADAPAADFGGSAEGYALEVSRGGVSVSAASEAGVFYALQTLRQLLHADGSVPCVKVRDWPRFAYRGMHFDVSRHFRDKEFIKKQLDAMARYKLNRFHWHLTDGAGWRLQIDAYPLLTEVAAWRPYNGWKEWWNGGRKYCTADTPGAEGGYYTKEDVREVLDYARSLHITVIPEIEMPGHSEEVLAVYPELSCTGRPYESSEFCIGTPKTYEFLGNVLEEVIQLFPSEYIHIGGDEASRAHWEKCPKCQAMMRSNGYEDEYELQSHLVRWAEDFLNARGRKLVGWDEIMLGGVTPTATVMAWRGSDWGVKAALAGNDVVMSPGEFCYLDAYQDAPFTQPEAIGGYLTLEKAYSFEPVPDSLDVETAGRFIGVQANVWAEYIPTAEHAEYMIYPRLLAIAETAWSDPSAKDWKRFRENVIRETDWLQSAGYNPFDVRKETGERPEASAPVEHLAVGAKVTYNQPFSRYYPAGGDSALVDGVRGGWTYADKRWQGFINRDVDVTVDLGKVTAVSYVGAEFMQLTGPYLWQPRQVKIYLSEDGEDFREVYSAGTDVPEDASGLIFRTYSWQGSDSARFVRYHAVSNGRENGCLFTDEIVIR